MIEKVMVPLLPESVNDAVISKWQKSVGERVEEGDVLAELETDKIMLEVPAAYSGVITEILKPAGSRVEANDLLCHIDPAGPDHATLAVTTDAPAEPPQEIINSEPELTAVEKMRSVRPAVEKGPSVRKKMLKNSIQDKDIEPIEPGRISHDDIDRFLGKGPKDTEVCHKQPTLSKATQREDRRVPMTRLRQTIAKRLLESQNETASLTTFNEVDLSKVIDLRSKYKDEFKDKYGVKLGFMSFFTKACCAALHAFPEVNASIDGQDIIYHDYCDIGIAVSTEKGLLVPIIRDADQLDMAGVEESILSFSQKAMANKITLDDLTGGTFSITNGGVFGSMLSTPILNPPQSAILGMHNIVKRPIVVDNAIHIRPMMYLALTYDHRIIDGSQAVRFLVMVKELLEDPDRLLLQI